MNDLIALVHLFYHTEWARLSILPAAISSAFIANFLSGIVITFASLRMTAMVPMITAYATDNRKCDDSFDFSS